MIKKIRYGGEAILLYALFFIFRLLPLDAASACGGFIGRTIGPHLAASRKACRNLRMALPGKTEGEYRAIVRGMWDNLGRVIAEYPHLDRIGRERVKIVNGTIVQKNLPCFAISGHLANWEVLLAASLRQMDIAFDGVYRAPNNPWAARLLEKARAQDGTFKTIPKSKTSARGFVESITAGRPIAMLIDQKYNEGIAAPFFGHNAMTSTAFVRVPQKYGCPLIPFRTERLNGAYFRLTFCEPLETKEKSVEQVVAEAHRLLEDWITERPDQWLWLHRRWPAQADFMA